MEYKCNLTAGRYIKAIISGFLSAIMLYLLLDFLSSKYVYNIADDKFFDNVFFGCTYIVTGLSCALSAFLLFCKNSRIFLISCALSFCEFVIVSWNLFMLSLAPISLTVFSRPDDIANPYGILLMFPCGIFFIGTLITRIIMLIAIVLISKINRHNSLAVYNL